MTCNHVLRWLLRCRSYILEKAMAPADVHGLMDTDSNRGWLKVPLHEARIFKNVGWFLTTPTNIVGKEDRAASADYCPYAGTITH